MEVKTRDFGIVAVEKKDIIRFVSPLYGFEDDTEFIMLFDEDVGSAFCWLQSVKEPQICFILANASLVGTYAPKISPDVQKSIGDAAQEIWLVMVAAEDFSQSTVNLKSPVIIGTTTMRACQAILEEDYPIRYALFQGKENAVC